MITLMQPVEFEWDNGNQDKNWIKHKVSNLEAEEAFLDTNKEFAEDFLHSKTEDRYILIGETKQKRKLYIVFAVRKDKVRIISARDLNKKELHLLTK